MFGIICNNPAKVLLFFKKHNAVQNDDIVFYNIANIDINKLRVNAFLLQKNSSYRYVNIKIPEVNINLSNLKRKEEIKTLKVLQKIYNIKIFNPINRFNQDMIYGILESSNSLNKYLLEKFNFNSKLETQFILSAKSGIRFLNRSELIKALSQAKNKNSIVYLNKIFAKDHIIKVYLIRKSANEWKILDTDYSTYYKLNNPSETALQIASWIANFIPYLYFCTIIFVSNSPNNLYFVHFSGFSNTLWEDKI